MIFPANWNAKNIFKGAVVGLFTYYMVKELIPSCVDALVENYGLPKSVEYVENKDIKKHLCTAMEGDTYLRDCKEKIKAVVDDLKNAKSLSHCKFTNMLLYGETELRRLTFLKIVTLAAGFDLVVVSCKKMLSWSIIDVAREFDRILSWAERLASRRVIIFKNAEAMFLNRDDASDLQKTFTSLFLTRVSSSVNNDFMFAFSANDPNNIDEAILDRVATSIKI